MTFRRTARFYRLVAARKYQRARYRARVVWWTFRLDVRRRLMLDADWLNGWWWVWCRIVGHVQGESRIFPPHLVLLSCRRCGNLFMAPLGDA